MITYMPQFHTNSALYGSGLYLVLDDEETKVWYYSVEKLFQLFEEEMSTGKAALDVFQKHRVFDYIASCYDVLHANGRLYIVGDIDKYIARREG